MPRVEFQYGRRRRPPLDVFPQQASHEPKAKVGDPVADGGTVANPFRKELDNPDDGDKKMGRLSKLGRAGVRGADDLKSYGSDLTQSSNSTIASFDPPDSDSYTTTTEVPTYTPQIQSATPQVDHSDVVGTAIMMGAVVVEGGSRIFQRRKRNKHG